MRKRKPISPLHRRLKWDGRGDRHWFTERRGWVAINLTHIHGTSYRVAAGTLDETVTAKDLDRAKRRAVAKVQAWIRSAAKSWEAV